MLGLYREIYLLLRRPAGRAAYPGEILKQFCGSPINLTTQVGILSLANQNLYKGQAIKDVQLFLHLYLDLPVWALLFVPPRLVGKSLVQISSKLRR